MSGSYITHLTNMNRAAQDVTLGTRMVNHDAAITSLSASATTAAANVTALQALIKASASYTAVTGDASASSITLSPGIGNIRGFMVQPYTTGSYISSFNVVNSGGSLVVKSTASATWVIAAGDILEYTVW